MVGLLKPYIALRSKKKINRRWSFRTQFIRWNQKRRGFNFRSGWFRTTITFRDANGWDQEQNDWGDKVVSEESLEVGKDEGRNMIKIVVNFNENINENGIHHHPSF